MADQNAQPSANSAGGYGYTSDEVKVNPFNFGLNAGNCFLTKFEWIPNGGKDGAEQEALDIVFNINGTEKSYRKFPVTKAFGKDNVEVTDPNAPEMKEAMSDFNSVIVHILHCFMDGDSIKAAMSVPIKDFKHYCQIAMSILPKTYKDTALDIFLQWGWQLRDNQEKTYLEIPARMKQGKWLCVAQAPISSTSWKEVRTENPADTVREALIYVDGANNKHQFIKNGWFMNSNFAHQQRTDGGTVDNSASNGTTSSVSVAPAPQAGPAKPAASW
jgi:hypothetical protein